MEFFKLSSLPKQVVSSITNHAYLQIGCLGTRPSKSDHTSRRAPGPRSNLPSEEALWSLAGTGCGTPSSTLLTPIYYCTYDFIVTYPSFLNRPQDSQE